MAEEIEIRAARSSDMAAVAAINKYYVLNTVITFVEEPRADEHFVTEHRLLATQGLPYLVATTTTTAAAAADDADAAVVTGYANAHGFRGEKGAYRHTVELTLSCHPDHRGRGVGSRLLSALLDCLRSADARRRYGCSLARPPRETRHVLAVMAVDEQGRDGGLALQRFYERHGFEERGRLKKVGFKFDRWIDTVYLQLSLEP